MIKTTICYNVGKAKNLKKESSPISIKIMVATVPVLWFLRLCVLETTIVNSEYDASITGKQSYQRAESILQCHAEG